MQSNGIKLQAGLACLYCNYALQKRRGWEHVDICQKEECDPHGSGDPRRCPNCGSGHFVFMAEAKGSVQLQCSVCDSFFESRHLTRRLAVMIPDALSLSGEPR